VSDRSPAYPARLHAPSVSQASPTSERLSAALTTAGIPPERRGRQRAERLTQAERAFYHWILRSFAEVGSPRPEAIQAASALLGLSVQQALARLASEDLVHANHDELLVAYPFSARPRGHRVLIDNSRTVEAMCAIDALGIGPMLGVAIEVTSRDPISGGEIWVRLDPAEGAWWEPEHAVVLTGSVSPVGPSFQGCCDVLNFFESTETAEQYLRDHPDIAGFPISIPDAIEAGRAVFGTVLEEA
jgi:hypothetical protein